MKEDEGGGGDGHVEYTREIRIIQDLQIFVGKPEEGRKHFD
jgi:hypothetical protein